MTPHSLLRTSLKSMHALLDKAVEGMTTDEANAVRISDVAKWHAYQQRVWEVTDAYLATMSPEEFDTHKVTIKPLGEMSLWDGLYGVGLSHGYRHVGEIEYVRGVQGLGGLTI